MLAQENPPLDQCEPEWFKKIPQPKFKIGQEVEYTETGDDYFDDETYGVDFCKRGVILGCWFAQIDHSIRVFNLKWVYQIYLEYDETQGGCLEGTVSPHCALRIEEIPEDTLDDSPTIR